MGLLDRDYMRNRTAAPESKRRGWLGVARTTAVPIAATIILFGAGIGWLYLSAGDDADGYGPAEGSLRVNINTATSEELESVPGIGPARAALISGHRQWKSVDDLTELDGFSPKVLETIRPFIKVDGKTARMDGGSPRSDSAPGLDWRSLLHWLLPFVAGLSLIVLLWSRLWSRRSRSRAGELEREAERRWQDHRRDLQKKSDDAHSTGKGPQDERPQGPST